MCFPPPTPPVVAYLAVLTEPGTICYCKCMSTHLGCLARRHTDDKRVWFMETYENSSCWQIKGKWWWDCCERNMMRTWWDVEINGNRQHVTKISSSIISWKKKKRLKDQDSSSNSSSRLLLFIWFNYICCDRHTEDLKCCFVAATASIDKLRLHFLEGCIRTSSISRRNTWDVVKFQPMTIRAQTHTHPHRRRNTWDGVT